MDMDELKQFLESLDPRAWYVVSAAVVWLVLWVWRRYLPGLWVAVTAKSPALTQVPAVLIGALVNAGPALSRATVTEGIQEVIMGAIVSALGAQGFHAAFKALPVPYDGAQARVDAAKAFLAQSSERPTPPSGPNSPTP